MEKKGNGKQKGKDKANSQQKGKNTGCFLCNSPYFARDCTKKEKISALIARSDDDGDGVTGETLTRMNLLQLLNANTMEKQAPLKGLMYVVVTVNGKEVRAMIDTGATNNFVSRHEAERLGLKIVQNSSKLKVVNFAAKPIQGSAVSTLKVGS